MADRKGYKRKLYAVYDNDYAGVCMGLFTSWQIAEQFGIEQKSVKQAIHRKSLILHRYEIVPTEYFEGDEDKAVDE